MSEENVDELNNALAEAIKAVDDVIKEKENQQQFTANNHILLHGLPQSHSSVDWSARPFTDESQIPPMCLARIKRDLMAIYQEPPPGILVIPEEEDITTVHALITGCFDTPYEGGFFYFLLRFPLEYPMNPVSVRLMTTGGNKVRFNPNLYRCGKVCMSILGTWSGPAWSPAQTLSSVLISIQSLLTEKPYHNEPGFERERQPGDVAKYSAIVQHETLRVAVIGMIDNDFDMYIPKQFSDAMEKSFLQFYDLYENVAETNIALDGTQMQDPFGEAKGTFQYATLLSRLREIKKRLEADSCDQSSTTSSIESD